MVEPAASSLRNPEPSPDERAVAAAVALPMTIVQDAGHGHAGTAMALAPLAHVLFQRVLRHDPADPHWLGRDRFVLSAGHAGLVLYTQLHLTGYGLSLADLTATRTLGSLTPGHPERDVTPGVEMSTGPLGQGLAAAVGIAVALRREAAVFGAPAGVLDPTVWALAGDGCLQEGVSAEASSLAGTLGLENLVVLWDDNGVTIDGPTSEAFTEDVRARYRAAGWRVLEIPDVGDLAGIERVLLTAAERTGRPTFVAVRTTIAHPAARAAGTSAAHAGPLGAEDVGRVLTALGYAPDATPADLVAPDVLAHCRRALERGARLRAAWGDAVAAWREARPEDHARWRRFREADPADLTAALAAVPAPEPGGSVATRVANAAVIRALQGTAVWGGSADLADSTGVAVPGRPIAADHPDGDFLRFGVREHAMAAILNGMALAGPWRPFGSTYLTFSDYARPAIRLAALMGLGAIYVFTHDSPAVGEDGPTHQAVEQVAGLRTVPGLDVVRPADAAEVTAAWHTILARPDRPVALVLSRQALPVLPSRADLVARVARGAHVVRGGPGDTVAILATGSEVALALGAAEQLAATGVAARVVSVPCLEWFERQPPEYVAEVLPPTLRARVAVEATRGDAWYRWADEVVGLSGFGEAGPGPEVMARAGMTVDAVVDAVRRALAAR